jgi:hypothetical protein
MTLEGGETKMAIIKTTKNHPEPEAFAATIGMPREAFFFNKFGQQLTEVSLPTVWNAHGNMETGNKVLLMEDLTECVQAGYFFGQTSPLNYGKDLEDLTKGCPYSAEQVASACFKQAALIHGKYWGDKSLLECSWLKGTAWINGESKENWEAHQKMCAGGWAKTSAAIKSGETTVKWCPHLISVMDASIGKTSWSDFQAKLKTREYIFCHGDFHPGNVMIRRPAADASEGHAPALVLIDFEMVGMGGAYNGAAECAQMLISHMAPDVRRECEDRLLQTYHMCLTGIIGTDTYSMAQCKADYVAVGTTKWVWLLGLLSGGMPGIPDFCKQIWNDQLSAFVKDHGITPENVEMPFSC